MRQRPSQVVLAPVTKGLLAGVGLLVLYLAIVTLISGWSFAQDQFVKFWYFIITLAFGFGVQVGLYIYLKKLIQSKNNSGRILAASGTTSTVAMISCCSHYLVNILPVLGITGVITIISQYQIQFFWVGLAFNLAGVFYMANKVYRFSRGT